jgi:outer membrane protein OmpA-like peptidoglycan-associated protein
VKYLLFFTLLCAQAGAQTIRSATPQELADQLAPPATATTRSLVPAPRKLDLMINFEFNSAKLQPASKPLVAALAEAMRSERVKDIHFRVEGHTDGVGKPEYNLALSDKRAQAVADYLASLGVAKERLVPQGKGDTELLLPDNPQAMENRRVRITTLD